ERDGCTDPGAVGRGHRAPVRGGRGIHVVLGIQSQQTGRVDAGAVADRSLRDGRHDVDRDRRGHADAAVRSLRLRTLAVAGRVLRAFAGVIPGNCMAELALLVDLAIDTGRRAAVVLALGALRTRLR